MAEMNTNTAELLQQMIDIKKDTRASIKSKGVEVVGGMVTYPEAIDSISQVFTGNEIDFTRAGWLQSESDRQNQLEGEYIENALRYSNLMWKNYGDYLNWSSANSMRYAPSWEEELVIAPMIVNYELDLPVSQAPFYECRALRYVPSFDTSRTTNFNHFFYECGSLLDAPILDTSKGTSFWNMFYQCGALTSIPQYDTSNAENVNGMFYGCLNIRSIPKLNFSKVRRSGTSNKLYILNQCYNLEYLGGFEGLKISIDLTSCYKLTRESVLNVLNNIYDWTTNPDDLDYLDWTGNQSLIIQISPPVGELLSEDDIAIATNKGWSIVF